MSDPLDLIEEVFVGFLLVVTVLIWIPALIALKLFRWLSK